MANFYKDNPDIKFVIDNLDISESIKWREENFEQVKKYDFAPLNEKDARDSYERVLDIVGEIAGCVIAPFAESVDEEGAHYYDGRVEYAYGTKVGLKLLSQADVMGFTLPREYGGLNFPAPIYSAAIEIVSRADASIMNLFGLQDIAETINEFADDEIKRRYLPRFASGEVTGAMILTEPDAGSDLQAVQTRAEYDEKIGMWRIYGVKRFITNGYADIALILARSEPGTTDGRGLSMFIYERDDTVRIRRIENKLGIHGSPTCEIQYNGTPAYLIGKRKMGLIKYVMALMNAARMAVSAQALGIAEAAYRAALKYAREREQFKRAIIEFPAVYDMLCNMAVNIEATRALLYETSRFVDLEKGYERLFEKTQDKDMRPLIKEINALSGVLTPMTKYFSTEMANKVCSDAIQVHGGTGFMKEFAVQRLYRDVRITNIYEGTSQLQVIGAFGGVMTRVLEKEFDRFDKMNIPAYLQDEKSELKNLRNILNRCIDYLKNKNDNDYNSLVASRLVEMAVRLYTLYLLLLQAVKSERKRFITRKFLCETDAIFQAHSNFILKGRDFLKDKYRDILDTVSE
ncbi:MAG: acyl-CoA dehydrogenase family protein [Candidatus Hydrogenedentota bacterium]